MGSGSAAFLKCRELCMALTVASRHYVPKAPVRLHKRHRFSLLLKEGGAERRKIECLAEA